MAKKTQDIHASEILRTSERYIIARDLLNLTRSIDSCDNNEQYDKVIDKISERISDNLGVFEKLMESLCDILYAELKEKIKEEAERI